MNGRAKRVTAVMAAAFGVAALGEGCRTATQMELVVTYDGDCTELQGVAFIVGTDPYASEKRIDTDVFTTTTTQCSPGRIGTLVVTPNGSTDHAAVIVLAAAKGKRVEDCKPIDGYADCIVARRSFSFVEHTALTLEIPLERACKDVPCDAISTCKHALCVDSHVDCGADGCNKPGELSDGGLATVDAPTSSDAFVQGDHVGATDAPEGVDAPVDAPGDTSTGLDAGMCGASDEPVTCMTNSGTKTCTVGAICCLGYAPASDAGSDGGGGGSTTYDCRAPGDCMPMLGSPQISCRSSRNCPANEICCLNPMYNAFCFAGTTCPSEAGASQQLCELGCECASKSCGGTTMAGTNPPQTFSTCN